MRIFIMTDLEGVAGVLDSKNWCFQEGPYCEKAKELLTMELNAAVEGFLTAGATEILVAEGHGDGRIQIEKLHPKVELVKHWHQTNCLSALEDRKFDFSATIGQHPMAGTIGGHLSHSGNMGVIQQTINDIEVGEFGEMVFLATELGVRTIFATGCQAFCKEAQALVPGIETVAVKRGTQTTPGNHLPREVYRQHNQSAIHLHPEEARRRIRQGAQKALERAQTEDFGLIDLPKPPYTRVRIIRGDNEYPPRILIQTHPKSILEMRQAESAIYELEINPAEPQLRELRGKRIV